MEEKGQLLASDALRLGALIRPKADGVIFDERHQTSCALGAMMEAVGVDITKREGRCSGHDRLYEKYPILGTMTMPCPRCTAIGTCTQLIAHLNNNSGNGYIGKPHNLSREEIADYLEGIEVMVGIRPMPLSDEQVAGKEESPLLVLATTSWQ